MSVEHITRAIVVLRERRVLLDTELAALYDVTVKRLNEQVRRNRERFPGDFMFRITADEHAGLRSQIATLEGGGRRGRHRKYLPYAFTEHGAIMAATVLNSRRAVEVSIYVVRAFVTLREVLVSNRESAQRLEELETRIARQFGTYDQLIAGIFKTLSELMNPPQRPIGFTADLTRK